MKCGGCWAFSALSSVEWAQCVKKRGTYTVLRYAYILKYDKFFRRATISKLAYILNMQ